MSKKNRIYKFDSIIGRHEGKVYYDHVIIPAKIHDKIVQDGNKRVLCTINEHEYFHAGLLPTGDGSYYIILNKTRMKAFALDIGQKVTVSLEKDTSKYGMKMPDEFKEVLESDPSGSRLFEELTDGKKRNLIHLVASIKNVDLKITKALIIIDHLKANKGKIDFKLLMEAMKVKNRKY